MWVVLIWSPIRKGVKGSVLDTFTSVLCRRIRVWYQITSAPVFLGRPTSSGQTIFLPQLSWSFLLICPFVDFVCVPLLFAFPIPRDFRLSPNDSLSNSWSCPLLAEMTKPWKPICCLSPRFFEAQQEATINRNEGRNPPKWKWRSNKVGKKRDDLLCN